MSDRITKVRAQAGGAMRGRRAKLGIGVALLLGLFLGFLGFAPSAYAHHPSLTASVECTNTPGTYTVNFTSATWDTSGSGGLNQDIVILYGPSTTTWPTNSATQPAGSEIGATGKYEDTANAATDRRFSGSFNVSGNQGDVIEVIAWARGNWGNGNTGHELRGLTSSDNGVPVSLTLPGTCPKPDMDATPKCAAAASGIDISVKNEGNAPGDLTIAWSTGGSAQTPKQVNDLAGGGTTSVFLPINEGATYSITFTGDVGSDGNPANVGTTVLDCLTPPNPKATVTWECGQANAVVVFTNEGQEPATADILKNGQVIHNDVSPGSYNVPMVAGDENTTVTITVDFSGSTTSVVKQYEVDCQTAPNPKANVTWECGQTNAVVHFTNDGQEPATADIYKGDTLLHDNVTPGDYNVPMGPGDENTTVKVVVDFTGSTASVEKEFEVDCLTPPAPEASVAWECGDANAVVTLTNSGDEPATATVKKNGVAVASGVAIPSSVNVPIGGGDENTTVTITVEFSDGTETFSQPIEVDCDHPAPTISEPQCAEGGVSVVLGNEEGEDTATFTVSVNGAAQPNETVAAGQSKTITITVAEGDTVSFTITSGDAELIVEDYTRDCEEPKAVSIELDCAEGGVVVELVNDGELDAIVQVNGEDVTVPAGGSKTVVVPVEENADYDFDVVIEGVTTDVTGTRDCDHPEPSVEQKMDCTPGGGVTLTLINNGDDTATFVVTSPVLEDGAQPAVSAAGTTEIEVPAGETRSLNIPVAEDSSTELTVTSGGTTLYEDPVSRDCETVEGEVVEPEGPLPRTGIDVMVLVGLSGALLLVGWFLIDGARRREAHVTD